MEEIIIAVLGSTVFGTIIAQIFGWAQNRKNNCLSYITEERKEWREKIRNISIDIQQCEYRGEGKKDIKVYLTQLEMNINPYGRGRKANYSEDGHIWDIIEKIRMSQDKKVFEKNKKLLLNYLTILLKEEWERSKKEINGYSNILLCIGITGGIVVLYAIIYFYVFKLDNLIYFGMILIVNAIFPFLVKYCFIDKKNELAKERHDIRKGIWLKSQRKENQMIAGWVISIVMYMLANFWIVMSLCPQMAVMQMKYYVKEDTLYIYTELNPNAFQDLEKSISNLVECKVKLFDSMNDLPAGAERKNVNKYLIEKGVYNSGSFWAGFMIMFVDISMVLEQYILCEEFFKIRKSERAIEILKYSVYTRYSEDYEQLLEILEKVNLINAKNREYLGLMYKLLLELEQYLKNEITESEKNVRNLQEYEAVKINRDNLDLVNKAIKKVKKLGKTIRKKKKETILKQIKNDITNIKVIVLKS